MNYYERHVGDYLKDTSHLSLLEHGIYGRLLDVYYTRETAIPADQAMRLIGAKSDEEKSAARDVLNEFFQLCDEGYRHKRCDREIERYQSKQAKASASAKSRWSKPAQQTEGSADAMRTHSEGNAPTHQTPDTSNQTPVNTHTETLSATDGGRVCGLMRVAGLSDGNPGHPDLLALIDAGATDAEFTGAARSAASKGKGFAYAIGTLKRQRTDAATTASRLHVGPLPVGPPDRKSVQLQTAALMTGSSRHHPTEIIDVTPRFITAR